METVYLSRRNLETLLSKLDRVKAGDSSKCTLIKADTQNSKYPQTMSEIAVVAVENEDYYTDRNPGEVFPLDEQNLSESLIVLF